MTAKSLVHLDKEYIFQRIANLFMQGLGTEGALVALTTNWHYMVGDVVQSDHWEEMGFMEVASVNELILNLPSIDEVQKGTFSLTNFQGDSYRWELVDEYKGFKIKWQ
ncbi:MAG: hypothetical protein VR69_10565 [Peptococcaceae bacterium BRH_c4b]|nr:MAG: hypothetical protein VR69_10565 [Peptococcaceae bacterium BRH_c4b]